MAAEVKARITVDAANALKRIEEINKASGYTSASMSKMAKDIGAANVALEKLGGGAGSAGGNAFKTLTDQLEKQALAYSLVDSKAKAAAESATLYRNAIISLTKSGSLTKEQTDALVRSYNSYKTAAESAKAQAAGFAKSQTDIGKAMDNPLKKLVSIAGNILKFQLLMGPITAAVRGFRKTISDSMRVAAEAEQVYNKLATVFDGISDSANRASSSLAASLGVSGSTSAGALSTVGDLLQAQGMGTASSLEKATQWVSRFQDIIAFKDLNMSLEEFAQNFMSGAAGNLRNFRTFGSIVKESAVNAELAAKGYDKLTGSELELAKMTTRAELALRQQENAIGATEREWDNMLSINRRLNEQWKEYKENLGDSLNKFIKPAKTWLAEILDYTNDVTRALKEIEGGEFTVKVQQESSEDFLRLVGDTLLSYASGTNTARFFGKANEAIALASGATMSQIYPTESLTAQQIADVMRATGATSAQIREAIAGTNQLTVSDEVLADAQVIANRLNAVQQAAESAAQTIIASGEAYDSFTESLATLPGINIRSTNLAAIGAGVNEYNYEDLLESFGLTAMGQVSKVMRDVLSQMGGLGTDAFIDNIDKAFGLGDKEQAYTSWLNEIKDLYTILYNRQTKFGDVGEDTLQTVINLWGEVNDKLQKYLDGIERTKLFNAGIATMQGNAASYDRQFQLVGLEGLSLQTKELELDFLDLKESLGELSDDELKDLNTAYNNQIAALTRLYEAQEKYAARLEAEKTVSGILSNAKTSVSDAILMRQFLNGRKYSFMDNLYGNMNQAQASFTVEFSRSMNDLVASLKDVEKVTKENGQIAYKIGEELYTASEINETMLAYYDETFTSLADVVETISAWPAIGQRALGATGTLGGVVQAFQGDGDIWSKIVNALLTILENTESWGEIAEVLDQIFAMFEPVTEALVDFLTSMPWDIIIFALKVIASVIVTISKTVEMINAAFNWLWYNIKEAFRSLGEVIAHPIKAANGDLDVWNWKSFEEFASEEMEIYDKMVEYLGDIWDTSYKIERNTAKGDDYAKQLALLKSLYDNGVLNASEYSGSIARVTGSKMGTIEKFSGSAYAAGSRGITYYSGDIIINGYNRNPEELAQEIERVLERRSMAGANLY